MSRFFGSSNTEIGPNGELIIKGGLVYENETIQQINSNTNNLVIDNLGTSVMVFLEVSGNFSLTGIQKPENGESIKLNINNSGTGVLSVKANDAGSLLGNRIISNQNKSYQFGEGFSVVYSTYRNGWVVTGEQK